MAAIATLVTQKKNMTQPEHSKQRKSSYLPRLTVRSSSYMPKKEADYPKAQKSG